MACVWTQWTLRFGGDPAVTAAGRLAVLGGLAAAWAATRRRAVPVAVAGPLSAAALAAAPLAAAGAEWIAAAAPAGWLGGARGTVWLTPAGLCALGPAACAAGLLGFGRGYGGVRLCGAAAGAGAAGLLLAPLVGLQNAALACAAGALAAAGVSLVRSRNAEARPGLGVTGTKISSDMLSIPLALCCGALAAAGLRVAAAYLPLSVEVLTGRAAVGAAAVGVGVLLAARVRRDRRTLVAGLVAVVGAAAAFAGGPVWAGLNLWLNAAVETPWLLTDARILFAAALILPACVAAGLAGRARGELSAPAFAAFGAGLVGGEGLLASLPDAAVVAGAVALTAGVTVAAAVRCGSLAVRPRLALGTAAAVAAVCAGAFDRPPAEAAKTLFGVLPTLARQGGVTGRTLAQLDDARELARVETTRDTVTLWRERGTRLTVRQDGLPAASAALQPALAPRDGAAVLRAVLPLLWVNAPDRVLLLGTPGPETAAAVARFPVRQVVACDGRPAALAAVRRALTAQRAADPFADDRVTVLPLDPPLAARSAAALGGGGFDVILCDPPHPGTADAAAESTTAFAARLAGLLTADGVACRRVRTTDCGPAALVSAAATWRAAFAEVRCVEVGHGEFALLGTNAADGLADRRLGVRVDRPHVRRLLAECGWDWSVPLNLAAVGPEGVAALTADAAPYTAADGRSAFALSRSMLAWEDKPAALAAALRPVAGRLLDTAVPTVEIPRVNHRLQEVVARRELALDLPDRPWAYRKELKTRLTKHARSVIRQTSAGPETVRHPEDQRRVEFVEALAAATDLSDANLAALEAFAAPYDPLVTPALPGELARLYGRRSDRPAARLRCLLTAVHRAPTGDRGVRDVCEALAVLKEHPDVIPDAGERYDTANGLLQILKLRWELRGRKQAADGLTGKTGVALHDVRRSLTAAEDGFALLADAAPGAGVADVDRLAREAWLTRSLVRPLRSHRASVQRTHQRRMGMADALAALPDGS